MITEFFKITKPRKIYIYSVLISILAGLVAVLFSSALSTVEHIGLEWLGGLEHKYPPGETKPVFQPSPKSWSFSNSWLLFFLPIVGGLLVGCILQFFYSQASGAGTDSMIRAFHHLGGKIPGRGAFFKAVSTIFTLSSGGSGGREGPTAYIGAAMGSALSKLLGAGARARRTLLLAGTAGGLGAIFRAPLGGALTAVEIIYREDIESDSLVPCLISSVTAYLTFSSILGPGSLFEVGDVGLKNLNELPLYAFLGTICYGVGFIYVKLLRFVEVIMRFIKLPLLFKPALGGVFIGCLALVVPEVIGSGTGFLHETINGRSSIYTNGDLSSSPLSLSGLFLLLAFLKILATVVTIGSGGSGGLFAPSLFIGGMLGGAVATFSQWMFPTWEISVPSFILVGMGAFFSGVARTPFSAMIMISDIIGSYALLPPLMVVSVITFTLSSRWSIYKGQVHNRFKSPAHLWDMRVDILETLKVNKQLENLRCKAVISGQKFLHDLYDINLKIQASDFVVVNTDGTYYGMFSLKKIHLKSQIEEASKQIRVADMTDIRLKGVSINATLNEALQRIAASELDKVAVVDREQKVLGYVHYQDIFSAYYKYMLTFASK